MWMLGCDVVSPAVSASNLLFSAPSAKSILGSRLVAADCSTVARRRSRCAPRCIAGRAKN
jgi:hypothetical protein